MAVRRPEPHRTRAWIRGYALVGVLFVVAWITQPVPADAVTPSALDQLGPLAGFGLPATLAVGALFAFVPGEHLLFRTVLLMPLALYLSGMGALFTFRSPDPTCTVCDTTALTRGVGFAGQTAVWFAGRGAEEIALAVRRARR